MNRFLVALIIAVSMGCAPVDPPEEAINCRVCLVNGTNATVTEWTLDGFSEATGTLVSLAGSGALAPYSSVCPLVGGGEYTAVFFSPEAPSGSWQYWAEDFLCDGAERWVFVDGN